MLRDRHAFCQLDLRYRANRAKEIFNYYNYLHLDRAFNFGSEGEFITSGTKTVVVSSSSPFSNSLGGNNYVTPAIINPNLINRHSIRSGF